MGLLSAPSYELRSSSAVLDAGARRVRGEGHGLPQAERWAAVHTRPRCEWKVLEGFDRIGVAAYLPTFPRRKRYAGRVRTSRIPLFSGYLFYDSASILRAQVMRSYGVVRTLDADDDLLLANELTSLSRLLSIEGVVPRRIPLGVPGTPVEVTHGPFAGCRGHLVRVTGLASLVLRITFLGFGAEVEIDESVVRALPSEPGI